MSCACGCGGDRARHFTKLSGPQLSRTLGQRLIPVVDRLRDLNARFGLRPYRVEILRTSWSGGVRGVGVEEVTHVLDLLPTPKIVDLSAITEIVTPVGLDEVGTILLTEVSGAYSEDVLLGHDQDGKDVERHQQVYYEVEFLRPDRDGERRRFFPRSAPYYDPTRFQWSVRLERARSDRLRDGSPR